LFDLYLRTKFVPSATSLNVHPPQVGKITYDANNHKYEIARRYGLVGWMAMNNRQ
jgi:hypothetical protein